MTVKRQREAVELLRGRAAAADRRAGVPAGCGGRRQQREVDDEEGVGEVCEEERVVERQLVVDVLQRNRRVQSVVKLQPAGFRAQWRAGLITAVEGRTECRAGGGGFSARAVIFPRRCVTLRLPSAGNASWDVNAPPSADLAVTVEAVMAELWVCRCDTR